MSDAIETRPTKPFPAEGAAAVPPVALDPLAGDWSEGLRGPARALGIPQPRLLALDGLPQPAPLPMPVPAPPPVAPTAEEVEAPDAWGASEDPLQSAPPPASEPPSVIITFSEPPVTAPPPSPAPAFQADVTPATAAPAFLPDVTPPSPAPAFLPDVTPPSPAPAFQSAPPAPAPALREEGVVELRAEDAAEAAAATAPRPVSDADAWSGAVAGAPAGEATPWRMPVPAPPEPAAVPGPAEAAPWDQVTATHVPAPAAAGWEMPPPAPASAPPEPAADEVWSTPPPAGPPVEEWTAQAPDADWQEVKKVEAPVQAHAPDWGTLSSGPDWSAPPPAEAAPAEESWGSAPPPPVENTWDVAPAAASESTWDAPPPPAAEPQADWSPAGAAEPQAEWSAPGAPPARASAWSAAPAGASAMEQLDSEPAEPVLGAAQDLFGSVPAGASLAGEDDDPTTVDEAPPGELGPPEELASPEEFLKPVEDDDPDLLVPVEEEAPPPPPPPAPARPLAVMPPVGVGALFVPGEHRVAVHTRGGRTRRGSLKDVDLGKSQFSLIPQGGGAAEPVYHAEVKAIFFMLAPGEKPKPADGGRVRVTFADGRTIEGNRDGAEAKHGFFLVPSDAARTNTRRIYVAREATTDIKEG